MEKELPGVKKNISLSKFASFKIGGPAKYFFIVKTKEDLIRAIKAAKKLKTPFFVLGGGNNLLISDKGYKGLVIKMKNEKLKIKNKNKKSKIIKVEAEAGLPLGRLVNLAFRNKLSGLEWATGIPGTVGGAVCGNAGAFGKSMEDTVKTVAVLDFKNKNEKVEIFKNRQCKFNNRDSVFKNKKNLIIVSVEMQLKKGKKKAIENKMKECLEYKKKTQPLDYSSAGSIFKNPPGYFAGELIEKCGLKGKKIGEAKISEKHANFIVNLRKAKAKDVRKLMELAEKKVKNKFKVVLKEEIEII